MSHTLRRIITGHNDTGQSIIEIDGGPATELSANGSGLHEIWLTESVPADNATLVDKIKEAGPTLCPPSGAVKVRWFTVPVENPDASAADKEAAAALGFAAVAASHCRVDTSVHPAMHKTSSVDYIILISGEVDLLLDAGEAKALKPGDVVIQRGTNHAWVNTGTEPALLVAVLADAAPVN
jgi:mannose-6-phosphate isomerase-like protein (cupin superfamily)